MVLVPSPSYSLSLFIPLFFLFSFFFLHAHSTDIYKGQGLVVTEKTRLGSRPPSCHNKCNQCHPCYAVEVPSMPTRNLRPESAAVGTTMDNLPADYFYPLPGNRYSYYKPLGWKCRCGTHVYNP